MSFDVAHFSELESIPAGERGLVWRPRVRLLMLLDRANSAKGTQPRPD
jgi:hypothetical protein